MRKVLISVCRRRFGSRRRRAGIRAILSARRRGRFMATAMANNNYGHVRSLQVRIDQLQRQITASTAATGSASAKLAAFATSRATSSSACATRPATA